MKGRNWEGRQGSKKRTKSELGIRKRTIERRKGYGKMPKKNSEK